MLKIYGMSDDLIEIERIVNGENKFEKELDAWETITTISFSDGTRIRVSYGKIINGVKEGIWQIKVLESGSAESSLTLCNNPEAEIYSDIFCINAEIFQIRYRQARR